MSKQVDNNPKTRMGNAKLPFHLLPVPAMIEQSLAHADGGFKYMPNNWHDEPISVSVYAGAILRHLIHFLMGENRADDSQVHHLGHIMACCAMVIDSQARGTLNDNRAGLDLEGYHALLEDAEKRLQFLASRDVSKFDLHDVVRPNEKVAEEPSNDETSKPKEPPELVPMKLREGSKRRLDPIYTWHHCYDREPEKFSSNTFARVTASDCALDGGSPHLNGRCRRCKAMTVELDT